MIFPTVKRISPKLPCCGKCIRGTAGHRKGRTILIQLEKLRIGPGIRSVQRHINRNIPYNKDPLLIRIALQCEPLLRKQELLELIKGNLLRKLLTPFLQGLFPAELNILFPGQEAGSSKGILNGHV